MLGYSVEDNMAPKLDWLQARLELDAAQLRELVVAQPTLLGYSVDANIAPTSTGCRPCGPGRCRAEEVVLVKPQLLNYSRGQHGADTRVMRASRPGRAQLKR